MVKQTIYRDVWETRNYYTAAQKGSLDIAHPGFRLLKKYVEKANSIIDFGCGEGTRLSLLFQSGKIFAGVDISKTAINLAKRKYKKIYFCNADLEKTPLKDDSFDLGYSAFVLEHLANPEKVLDEAIRIIKPQGYLFFIAPNFGAPNRSSPCFRGSRITKLIKGLIGDVLPFMFGKNHLGWNKVKPLATKSQYYIDWDTLVEPYLRTLKAFFVSRGFTILESSSNWSAELPSAKIHQKIFRIFAKIGIYPFTYWGPHFSIVVQKK